MEDSRSAGPGKRPDEVAAGDERETQDQPPPSPIEAPKPKRPIDIRFVGGAMKSLFESADVSIRRDDETRVLSRAQEAIADLEQRHAPESKPAAASSFAARSTESAPPGPRVDVVLWVVLAAGLFGIAGWMLLYGL